MRTLQHAAVVPQIGAGEPSRWTGPYNREADRVPEPEPTFCPAKERVSVQYVAQSLDARTPRLPLAVDCLTDASLAEHREGLLGQLAELEALEARDLSEQQARLNASGAEYAELIGALEAKLQPYASVEPLLAQHRRDRQGVAARAHLALQGLRAEFVGRKASPDHGARLGHPIRHALRAIDAELKRRAAEKQARAAKLDEVKSLLAEAGVEL